MNLPVRSAGVRVAERVELLQTRRRIESLADRFLVDHGPHEKPVAGGRCTGVPRELNDRGFARRDELDFGVDPDGVSGALEMAIRAVAFAVAVASGVHAHHDRPRLSKPLKQT